MPDGFSGRIQRIGRNDLHRSRRPREVRARRTLVPTRRNTGGYALCEQSTLTLGGRANSASRYIHRGLSQFGGGVDVGVLRWLGFRLEVRDFYTGKPALNVSTPGDWSAKAASSIAA